MFDGLVQAIHDMFGNADEPDEERLECMVKLLQTCGKKLDQTGSPDTVKVSQSKHPANQIRSKQSRAEKTIENNDPSSSRTQQRNVGSTAA